MTLDITSNVDPEIAAAMQVYERLAPLKDALGLEKLTEGEMQLFAMVANHTGLDPFTRQIYAIKRGGKVTHQTGIDGYRSSAAKTHEYAGSDEAEFEMCECGDAGSPKEHPRIARVVVHRLLPGRHMVNQTGVARWHELKPDHVKPSGYEYLDSMWWRMPYNQLAKCAEAAGLRIAFPRVLGGVYIAEEMQQAETVEGTATPVAPTARERVRERRKALENPERPSAPPEAQTGTETAPVAAETASEPAACGEEDHSPLAVGICMLERGHAGPHKSPNGSFPR